MSYTNVRFGTIGQVATITLNRPDAFNAFNIPMLKELLEISENVALDENVRAVIFTGEGRAFCAGADVKGIDDLLGLTKEKPEGEDILKSLTRLILSIRKMPKPVVAALNGVAAGSGANLALACDIIIASEKARFAQNFVNIGLIPDAGGTFFLPQRIGYHRAAEHFFTGEILSAEQALELGLYNRVVPHDEIMKAAQELAADLAQRPTRAIAACKAILNREVLARLPLYLEEENRCQRLMVTTEDAREGITAFGEKRKPTFAGK
ncbi:MAG: enoyl-CoA hydratase [Deltaproteobacteria bacterium]|nr:enoyl-CoA hydratase [Deltaproteobacteria bacterium]